MTTTTDSPPCIRETEPTSPGPSSVPDRDFADEPSASEIRSFAEGDISATLPHFGPVDDLEQTTDPVKGLTETVDIDPHSAKPIVAKPSPPKHRYRVIKTFAKGGLGEVFIAEDQELKRSVALKEIQREHCDHSESRRRFVLEAEVTGRLEHPGIVPVYGLGHYEDGRPYYAMRFIHGDSFQKEVKLFHKQHPIKNSAFFYGRPFKAYCDGSWMSAMPFITLMNKTFCIAISNRQT